jgi:uncharacterized protein YoxC
MAKNSFYIKVDTLPNGYSLTVNNSDFMYFNPVELTLGFLAHVGLSQTKAMNKDDIITMVFQTMVGKEWGETIDKMTCKLSKLEDRTNKALVRLNAIIEDGERINPTVQEIKDQLQDIADSITEQKRKNREASKDSTEAKNVASETLEKVKNEYSDMKRIIDKADTASDYVIKMKKDIENSIKKVDDTLIKAEKARALAETAFADLTSMKVAVNEGRPVEGIESAKPAEPSKSDMPLTKGRGNRAKGDEAILRAMERQAQENPNIK